MTDTSWDPSRYNSLIHSLISELRARNITSILTYETPHHQERGTFTGESISGIADNLVVFTYHTGQQLSRALRVYKARNTPHSGELRPFVIGTGGLQVL